VISEIKRRRWGSRKQRSERQRSEASAYRGIRHPVAGHDRRADRARIWRTKSVPI